eukprot:CAMPEP_0202964694 /NCGR_PEP_ID=MMETSP1396-20130829/8786_1 /ASSEMBLY_ACC=CAM_ASM_000872 /TAXON_ID= /ORGANISM="Pseudokeronopsis sp., Strain Brazil" /LENGTH=77 /DNA_ID=CAMNT_0049686995 /DNA_START=492 /DNA_END=725 /DNA_ORIENTATION=+
MENFTSNDTCFFRVKARCGALAITPNVSDYVQIEFAEFTDSELSDSTGKVKGDGKSKEKPMNGMPERGRVFGEQAPE